MGWDGMGCDVLQLSHSFCLFSHFLCRMGFVQYSKISAVAATLITTATLVLRYHYFVDFLFALPLVAFGVWIGGVDTLTDYQSSVYPELFVAPSASASAASAASASTSTSTSSEASHDTAHSHSGLGGAGAPLPAPLSLHTSASAASLLNALNANPNASILKRSHAGTPTANAVITKERARGTSTVPALSSAASQRSSGGGVHGPNLSEVLLE
jgi:hypothetical protein